MADIFNTTPSPWSFTATPSLFLYNTRLPLPPKPAGLIAELESSGGKNARDYVKGTPRVGLEMEWFPWNRFSIYGEAIGSIPFKNTPNIYTLNLIAKYNIMNKDRLKMFLFAGVEYDQIDYEDSQTNPNHVKADMGPLGTFGVEMKF